MKRVQPKIGALVEVIAVFLLAVALFYGIRMATFSDWEEAILPGQGLFFLEYAVVLGIVLGVLAIAQRDWQGYGITLRNGKQQVQVIVVGVLPFLALGGLLGMVNWRTWGGSAVISIAAVGVLVVIGWVLRDKDNGKGTAVALALLALAPMSQVGEVGRVILKTIYFYCLAGPAEEILFRGYIQTRLNQGYGKPYRFFGTEWGIGLVVSAALFGLWHVAMHPLEGGAWFHGLWTLFAGIALGYVRERSKGIVAGSVLHSVMNYLPVFDLIRV